MQVRSAKRERSHPFRGLFLSWLVAAGTAACERAFDRARQRRQLATMSDRMLKDIGLSRAEADRESGRPWWRP